MQVACEDVGISQVSEREFVLFEDPASPTLVDGGGPGAVQANARSLLWKGLQLVFIGESFLASQRTIDDPEAGVFIARVGACVARYRRNGFQLGSYFGGNRIG